MQFYSNVELKKVSTSGLVKFIICLGCNGNISERSCAAAVISCLSYECMSAICLKYSRLCGCSSGYINTGYTYNLIFMENYLRLLRKNRFGAGNAQHFWSQMHCINLGNRYISCGSIHISLLHSSLYRVNTN